MELKFRESEVGRIPIDWSTKKLVQLAEIATGTTPPTNDLSNYGNEHLFVSPIDLGKGKWVFNTEKKLSKKGFSIARRFPKGSILFTCIGSTIGKSGMAPIELTSNQQINAVFPNEKYISDYIYYSLNLIAPNIKALAGEQAVPLINKTQFGETYVALPPTKTEQTAVATALSDTDALITSLEKLIAKKRNIKQGVMQELLKPKEGWQCKRVGQVLKVRHGKSQRDVEKNDGKYPILGTGGVIGWTDEYLCNADSVLIGRKGTIDKPQYMNTPFWTVDTLFYTEIQAGYSPKFIYYNFLMIDWYSYNEASGVPSLSAKTIERIELHFPKTLEDQESFAAILDDMDSELNSLERKLLKCKQLKSGMMQTLLTGKIRLV